MYQLYSYNAKIFTMHHTLTDTEYISSDIDKLKQVVVHPIGNERRHILPKFEFLTDLGFSSVFLDSTAENQHKNFVNILENNSVEVLTTHDLLTNALSNLEKAGELTKWLAKNFPQTEKLANDSQKITVFDLLGASDRAYYNFDQSGRHNPLSRPLNAMFFTRDQAVVLPEGVLLTAFNNKRSVETKLVRLMFEQSDQLKHIPIVFDAEKEGVLVQGGDVIVLDKNTLLIGYGNLTEKRAAKRIAQKLNKTVIGVRLSAHNSFLTRSGDSLGSLFLHLDTVFNLVRENKFLVVPYFFENKVDTKNPILSILSGAEPKNKSSLKMRSIYKKLYYKINLKIIKTELANLGKITLFAPGTGEQTKTNSKLVDYLIKNYDYSPIYVGGEPPNSFEERVKHLVEKVIPETSSQAANIVALEPGKVVMYNENTDFTQNALRKAGIEVVRTDGSSLATWRGGPHCMTLPIGRTPN